MSPRANVKRSEVFNELNQALHNYSKAISEQLKSIKKEINSILDWISERQEYWRREVNRRTTILQSAERAYSACMAQPSDDNGRRPNCSSQAAAVTRASRDLEKAQSELTMINDWRRKIDVKLSEYMQQATKLQRSTNTTIEQATAFLSRKFQDLEGYNSISPPPIINVIGTRGYEYEKAKQEMLRRALDDPKISRDIKGWIRNELRRINSGQSNRIRMPGVSRRNPYVGDYDAGHRIHDVHHWSNLRFEDVWLNRSRYHRSIRMGLSDRVR